MSMRAKEGMLLDELVAITSKYCRLAAEQLPRSGRGRRPTIPDWVLAVMAIIGVLLQKKSKNAQFEWWSSHLHDYRRWFPSVKFPARSSYYERYRRISTILATAISLQGRDAVEKGWASAATVAIDKSLVAGRGKHWSSRDRRRGHVPRGVDRDTTWGYSKHHKWVQGYSFETVVTADGNGVNWPLLASVDSASRSEQKSCLAKLSNLPPTTKHVLADAGYDSNTVAEALEWTAEGQRTGRHFLCPEVPRPNDGKTRQSRSRQSRDRQRHRRRRDVRRRYFQRATSRRLYARRKTTVELFNSHLKRLFDLEKRVWHWGLQNNRTMILAAIASYQTLLTYNHRRRRHNMCIKALLDRL